MTRNASITIREANGQDAQRIAAVHHAAVYKAAAGTYPPDLLKHWSGPINEDRITEIRDKLLSSSYHFIVAEADEVVVGFSSLDLESGELGGAFVFPDFGREGIGGQLLGTLEEMAVEKELTELFINSSLNAERFYTENGYESLGPSMDKLLDGTDFPTTRMRKQLTEKH